MNTLKKRNQKLTIVHVTAYYPPHLGGMENCVKELTHELSKREYNVKVFTSDQGVNNSQFISNTNYEVSYLKSIEFAHTPIIFSLFFKLLTLPKQSIMHLHISQAFIPEIVYLVSKIRKIPYISHIHLDVEASGPFGFLLKPYKKIFLSRILHNSSRIICLTENQKLLIMRKYMLENDKIVVVPNGVGKKFFTKRTIISKKKYRILFVGRLAMQKNLSLLLHSVSFIKANIIVDIVGEGEEEKELKKLAQKLNLKNVHFHGKKTDQDLINFYKNADLFLLTSKNEGMSLALLEAMACGLPIVIPEISGIEEFLNKAAIFVCNPSPSKIAKAVENLFADINTRRILSQRVQKIAGNYRWENIVSHLSTLYEELV